MGKKNLVVANLTGILYPNLPQNSIFFVVSFSFTLSLQSSPHFPLSCLGLTNVGKGSVSVVSTSPHRSSWWLVCLMFEFGEGTWRWWTVEDLVKKLKAFSWLLVSGILLHTLCTLFWSLGVVDEFMRRASGFVNSFSLVLDFLPLVFVFFSCLAWLL